MPILFLTLLVLPAGAVLAQTTVFTDQQQPDGFGSDGPYELGMTFSSTRAGNITAIRYWKAPGDNATHVGRIWNANGTQLAEVTFADKTDSGWQQQALTDSNGNPDPLAILANTTYTVSVNSGSFYPFGNDLPLTTKDGLQGFAGVFNNNPGQYPATPFGPHYFRDVVFESSQTGACISGAKRVSVDGLGGPYVRNSVTTDNEDETAQNPKITSVLGDNNEPDAAVDIPEATFGGEPVLYEFEITNCGDVDIYNLRVDDCVDVRSSGEVGFLQGGVGDGGEANCVQPRLIPTFASVDVGADGVFSPGETVTLRSTDDAFSGTPVNPYSSSFIDICETYGNARVDGIVRNDVEFEGEADLNGDGFGTEFVFFDELNLVQCKPGEPKITIEKFTNGYDADDANGNPVPTPPNGLGFPDNVDGNQVPVVGIDADITWTYVVTNTGAEALNSVAVTDSKGVNVICPDDTLGPNASFTCTASGTGLDLAGDFNSVDGCGSQGQGMTVPTYENLATVVGFGATSGVEVSDEDPSHYCNPPGVMVEKFTNGWDGDNANGIPAAGQGDFTVGAPQVAEVPSGDDITWTYVVTNTSSETLSNIVVTDDRGVTVTCPTDTLAAGASTTCTATGSAEDLQLGGGNVAGCGSGTGETRPTYENLGMVVATGNTTGVFVEDDDPSHYCNPPPQPECGLTLDKACEIPPPAPPSVGKCDGKLKQFTMVWNGDGPIGITVGDGLTASSATSAVPGDEVTFFTDGSTNDTIVNIAGIGESTFHVSCSDGDMDGDSATNDDQNQVSAIGRDCGKDQGDGKGDSGFINQWLLEGFVDNSNDVLDCTVDDGFTSTSCEFQAVAADCDFPVNDPDILTFRVTGGDCEASDNDQQPSKTECTGGFINPNQPVQVSVKDGFVGTLQPGETFDVERGGDPEIELFQGNVTQFNKFHGSCSQPLQAGDRYGANELVALDGAGLGTTVVYAYTVGNGGPGEQTGITVTDNRLGPIGNVDSLAEGESETLTATAFLTQTTTNTATAVASPTCAVDSNPVVVTVTQPPECDVSIAFKELKDDAIKWDLTNGPERKATLDTFTLEFPRGFDAIKEVKLDGNIFKADDSDTYPNGVPSGETIGPDDWTEEEVAKRQLDQGESRTLEVKFMEDDKTAGQDDFDLTVTFEEGCSVSF